MCRRTTCKRCGKPSWAGCGAHVEMVLGDVPKRDRCNCASTAAPPKQPATGAMGKFSAWLKK